MKESAQPAQACMIWMHGLGADAQDMAGLAAQPQFAHFPIRHVFLDAPVRSVTINGGMSMRAWYDILSLDIAVDEDKEGVLSAAKEIAAVIEEQKKTGFASQDIYLAGFSQGGAMALFTALHRHEPLAGVIALSAYLPLLNECRPTLPDTTPMFIANGRYDPIVQPAWTKECLQWLGSHGYNHVSRHEYPMEHTICLEEMDDLAHWLSLRLQEKGQ
ncbi:alpha/beta hydrolase [Legionella spiritensis]|uniref:alpha/beta hydrolase n=1 Tax=Legionella spiritensis TaxID=452 RepID=UPI0013EF6E80